MRRFGFGPLFPKFRLWLRNPDRYFRNVIVAESLSEDYKTILDLGGGNGSFSRFAGEQTAIVVADLDLYQLRQARDRGQKAVCADGCCLPFKNHAFDAVVSLVTLQYVNPGKRALFIGEMKRTTKEKLILFTTFGLNAERCANVTQKIWKFLGYPTDWVDRELELGSPDFECIQAALPGGTISKCQNLYGMILILACYAVPLVRMFPGLIAICFPSRLPPYASLLAVWSQERRANSRSD